MASSFNSFNICLVLSLILALLVSSLHVTQATRHLPETSSDVEPTTIPPFPRPKCNKFLSLFLRRCQTPVPQPITPLPKPTTPLPKPTTPLPKPKPKIPLLSSPPSPHTQVPPLATKPNAPKLPSPVPPSPHTQAPTLATKPNAPKVPSPAPPPN